MAGCNHDVKFDGVSKAYKRILWVVIAINGGMFAVELSAGVTAQSMALQADALDFLGDSVTYGLTLLMIGRSMTLRAGTAMFKGLSLGAMAIFVLGSSVHRMFVEGVPNEYIMGSVGFMALAANLISVFLLMRFREGDANVRSVWLCSRNDAIGNVAVIAAAVLVGVLGSAWPDLIVAMFLASLFLSSSFQILRQAIHEMREHRSPVIPAE